MAEENGLGLHLDNEEKNEPSLADISSFVWKDKREGVYHKYGLSKDGPMHVETKMVEMDEAELNRCYAICHERLYSENSDTFGNYPLLREIAEQKKNCNISLFLRWIKSRFNETEYELYNSLREFINNNMGKLPDIASKPMSKYLVADCPTEFKDITINDVMKACMDSLGYFSSRHLPKKLVYSQGIFMTSKDMKELKPNKDEYRIIMDYLNNKVLYGGSVSKVELNSTKPQFRLYVLKLRLGIKLSEPLQLNPCGLTCTEFRAMYMLSRKKRKYSELTTDQLKTLRNKMLLILERKTDGYITLWKRKMREIRLVAELKGYQLNTSKDNKIE